MGPSWSNLQRPHCIVWGRPWRLKIGAHLPARPSPQRYGDTVREREEGGGKLDSLTAFFSRPTAAPEARRCQFSRISGAVGRAFTLVELRIVPWKIPWVECLGIPSDRTMGPVWWPKKERREKKKREEKRGLSGFPQPSSLMKKWDLVGLSPQLILGQQRCRVSDAVGRQSRVDGLWV